VIKVFAAVLQEIPAKLMMVGDGPERPVAEELARHLGVINDVSFVGKQEQMEDIMNVSDIFLLTSDYESFGLSALEAMAARSIVISTNAGGLPEINIDGVTGFMANVGDVDAMSKQAITVLKDDLLLAKMKEQAFEQANKFSLENIIPLYEKCIVNIAECNVSLTFKGFAMKRWWMFMVITLIGLHTQSQCNIWCKDDNKKKPKNIAFRLVLEPFNGKNQSLVLTKMVLYD